MIVVEGMSIGRIPETVEKIGVKVIQGPEKIKPYRFCVLEMWATDYPPARVSQSPHPLIPEIRFRMLESPVNFADEFFFILH